MTPQEQIVLAAVVFLYVGSIVKAALGESDWAHWLSVFALVLSIIWIVATSAG